MKSTTIKELLDQHKLTQFAMSQETGIDQSQISKWCTKETTLRPSTTKVVLQYFARKALDNTQVA